MIDRLMYYCGLTIKNRISAIMLGLALLASLQAIFFDPDRLESLSIVVVMLVIGSVLNALGDKLRSAKKNVTTTLDPLVKSEPPSSDD